MNRIWTWILVALTLILLAAAWIAMSGPRLARFEKVVGAFQAGKLKPDEEGTLSVPDNSGKAFHEELEDGRDVILFGTRIEDDMVLEGWLWCSGKIQADDYVTEIGPRDEIQHTLSVCGSDRLAIRETRKPHWYFVMRLAEPE